MDQGQKNWRQKMKGRMDIAKGLICYSMGKETGYFFIFLSPWSIVEKKD